MGKRKRRSKSRSEEYEESSSKRSKKGKTIITIKKKRKNWSPDLDKRFKIMKAAVEDVIEKKMTIRKAAEKWGVKRSTLADRVSGRVELGRRSGPPSILTRAEEQMLAEWIINMAQRGYGFKKHKLLKTVKKILDKDKRTTILKRNMPGNKWFRQFVKRNPRVKVVTSNQQVQGPAMLEKTSKELGMDYERFNTMVSAYNGTESTSEEESESESELESELGSEVEEVEEELQPESPDSSVYKTEVVIESEPVLKGELEPKDPTFHENPVLSDYKTEVVIESEQVLKLESDRELEPKEATYQESPVLSDYKTEVVIESEPVQESEPAPVLETEVHVHVAPEMQLELEPELEAEQKQDSEADAANPEDDHSPSPDISVANTVTITTSE